MLTNRYFVNGIPVGGLNRYAVWGSTASEDSSDAVFGKLLGLNVIRATQDWKHPANGHSNSIPRMGCWQQLGHLY